MRLFNYVRKSDPNLGQGTMNLGLCRTQTPPLEGMYDPSRNPRMQIYPTPFGAVTKLFQSIPSNSLLGFNGGGLNGQFAYQTLAEINRNRRGQ